jgi:hypothetical protein
MKEYVTRKMSGVSFDENEIKKALQCGEVYLTFEKADGSMRLMRATLKQDYISGKLEGVEKKTDRTKKPNQDVQCVFDCDLNEWRSFRWDSLRSAETSEICSVQ